MRGRPRDGLPLSSQKCWRLHRATKNNPDCVVCWLIWCAVSICHCQVEILVPIVKLDSCYRHSHDTTYLRLVAHWCISLADLFVIKQKSVIIGFHFEIQCIVNLTGVLHIPACHNFLLDLSIVCSQGEFSWFVIVIRHRFRASNGTCACVLFGKKNC